MIKANVTRDDVAKLAGVSSTTVSNVINNKGRVGDDVREKVVNAIKKLNYTPNVVARSLMTGSSKHIGLVIDEITNPHFTELAKGAQYEANLNGYILTIGLSESNLESLIDEYMARNIDGIIYHAYSSLVSKETKNRLREKAIPFVAFGSFDRDVDILLSTDYYGGMKQAYLYLLKLGHTNIAYISGQSEKFLIDRDKDPRLDAYIWCCNQFNSEFDTRAVVFGKAPFKTDYEEGYRCGKELLNRSLNITAIIVVNDYMALGVMQALRENNIQIPRDISIIGFDNTVYASSSYPKLTSISTKAYDLGRRAVQCIIQKKINVEGAYERIIEELPTELIIRDSTIKLK